MPLPQWTTITPKPLEEAGSNPPTCNAVLEACGRAVEAQKRALADQQAVIAQLKAAQVNDREALAKAQDKGFFENPAVLILLGALGGVILTEKVLK